MLKKLLLFLVFYIGLFSLQASNRIEYGADMSSYIGKNISYYEDPTNKLGIKNILDSTAIFVHNETDVPNFGMTESTYWLKFDLLNKSDCYHLIVNLENPLLSYANFYVVKDGVVIDSILLNNSNYYNNKAFDHQYYTYNLLINKGEELTIYIKTHCDMSFLVPLSIHNKSIAINKLMYFDLRTGIFIGIMLAMLLYNLFLYVSARDRQYLYYVNYIFWVTMAQAAILGLFHRFWPADNDLANYIVPFSGAMSAIASVVFVRSFLSIREYTSRFSLYLNLIIIADLIAIAMLFVDITLAYQIVNITAGIGSFFVFYIAIYVKLKGNKAANFFLIAWGVFLTSVIVFVLKDIGVIKYSQFTTYVVQLGVSVEGILLSFALGNKMNTYRREKEEFQQREFLALQENERLIREQNELLEVKIEERTQELQQANESLENTLVELKEAQSQLVESEKLASLGQLTAGVAHEINNPINFVTSNVKPLKRDLELVWEAFTYMENVAYDEGLTLEDKKAKISAYKNQQDIDYLRTEMDFLLKGMHEGASRTAEIVKSLRIFSRVDEDSVIRADINMGIDSTLVILGSLLSDHIQVDKNLENIPPIYCYPGKLNQVFLNILTNAIYAIDKKFQTKKGGVLKISSNYLADSSQIKIVVEDNGIGIPADVINKIFDPFFTTKDVGEGTGLGMSIAYNTIAKHNGEIKVSSIVGEGTIFAILLPIHQM